MTLIRGGLGETDPYAGKSYNAATKAHCLSLPTVFGSLFGACRDVYADSAADLYEIIQYGATAPAAGDVIGNPGTMTPQEHAEEIRRKILEYEEATGYRPGDATFRGMTAEDILADLANLRDQARGAATSVFNWMPWAIGGGLLITYLVLTRGRS